MVEDSVPSSLFSASISPVRPDGSFPLLLAMGSSVTAGNRLDPEKDGEKLAYYEMLS